MRSDVKEIVQNQFWSRQMLEFIHPRYSLSKYQRNYGECLKFQNQQKQKCIADEKSRIDDMMIFAEYYRNKNTKCIEEGMLAGYDWSYVQKYCWNKIFAVMERAYPLSEEERKNLSKIQIKK